jgi:ZIP family zinc transporter
MVDFMQGFHPVLQALLATCFTWGLTALGAATVFLSKDINRKLLDLMLGFAGGVMIAASYWSLLAPAIEMSEGRGLPSWVPAVTGFLLGGVFLRSVDKLLPHFHIGADKAEGLETQWQRITLLVIAVTLHNFPEGLAIGVAFGAAALGLPSATVASAVALAIGIGIQNFPEGIAVSVPLRQLGLSRPRCFFYGQLSGMVEPVAGVIGVLIVLTAQAILPYVLAFAAGAMIFVVVEDLIPESHRGGNVDVATMGVMAGFAVMMLLDVALG